MNNIELTEQEQSIIENALNAHFHDAHNQLTNRKDLGVIEKKHLEKQKELSLATLKRFENIY